MPNLEVAQTIWKQLISLGKFKVMSWGANNLVGCSKENFLQFKVKGLKFKGTVRIKLNGMDLYDISFYKRGKLEVEKEYKDVFAEDMVDIIDRYVEYTGDDKSYKKALIEDDYKRNKSKDK